MLCQKRERVYILDCKDIAEMSSTTTHVQGYDGRGHPLKWLLLLCNKFYQSSRYGHESRNVHDYIFEEDSMLINWRGKKKLHTFFIDDVEKNIFLLLKEIFISKGRRNCWRLVRSGSLNLCSHILKRRFLW